MSTSLPRPPAQPFTDEHITLADVARQQNTTLATVHGWMKHKRLRCVRVHSIPGSRFESQWATTRQELERFLVDRDPDAWPGDEIPVERAAEMVGMTRQAIYHAIRRKLLPARKRGARYSLRRADVLAWRARTRR